LKQFTDDPGVQDTLTFVMTREVAHYQQFTAALNELPVNFPPGTLSGDERFQNVAFNMSDGGGSVRGPWNQGQGPWPEGIEWDYVERPTEQWLATSIRENTGATENPDGAPRVTGEKPFTTNIASPPPDQNERPGRLQPPGRACSIRLGIGRILGAASGDGIAHPINYRHTEAHGLLDHSDRWSRRVRAGRGHLLGSLQLLTEPFQVSLAHCSREPGPHHVLLVGDVLTPRLDELLQRTLIARVAGRSVLQALQYTLLSCSWAVA
jgi:hypothetical protein